MKTTRKRYKDFDLILRDLLKDLNGELLDRRGRLLNFNYDGNNALPFQLFFTDNNTKFVLINKAFEKDGEVYEYLQGLKDGLTYFAL